MGHITASGNGDGGFSAINECVFTGCVAANNDGLGFNGVNGPAISHCTAYGNGAGGFACGNNARVLACTSNSNDTWGISSGVGGLVADCVVSSNTTNGIVADSNAIVLRNTCEGNGSGAGSGAGIYACKATVDMFHLEKNDFIPQLNDIITVGDFYEMAAGGQIIFT